MHNRIDDLGGEPLVAAVDRSELVKHQLRDRKGRWVEMGAEAKIILKSGELFNGIIGGIDGEYAIVNDIKKPDGTPVQATGKVHYSELEMLAEKADLDDIGAPGPSSHGDGHGDGGSKPPAAGAPDAPVEEPDYGFDKPADWSFVGQLEDPNGDDAFVFNTEAGNRVIARTRGSMFGATASNPYDYAFAVYKGNTDTPHDAKHNQLDHLGTAQVSGGVPALESKVDGAGEKVDKYSSFISADDQVELEHKLTTLEQMLQENGIDEKPEWDDLSTSLYAFTDGLSSDSQIGKQKLSEQVQGLRAELQKVAPQFEDGTPEAAKLQDAFDQLKKVDPNTTPAVKKATLPDDVGAGVQMTWSPDGITPATDDHHFVDSPNSPAAAAPQSIDAPSYEDVVNAPAGSHYTSSHGVGLTKTPDGLWKKDTSAHTWTQNEVANDAKGGMQSRLDLAEPEQVNDVDALKAEVTDLEAKVAVLEKSANQPKTHISGKWNNAQSTSKAELPKLQAQLEHKKALLAKHDTGDKTPAPTAEAQVNGDAPDAAAPNPFQILDDPGANGDGYFSAPGTHFWGKYGAAGIMLRHKGEDGQDRYLLVQRGPMVSTNKGKWQLPGGALNGNENDYQGAARELHEELGVPQETLNGFEHAGDHLFQHESGWHYNNIAANAPEQFVPSVDGTETSDAGWFTREQVESMDLHPSLKSNLDAVFGKFKNDDEAQAFSDAAADAAADEPNAPEADAPHVPLADLSSEADPEELKVLKDYTYSSHDVINGVKRGTYSTDPGAEAKINTLQSLLDKSTLKEDGTFFRGAEGKGWAENLKPGDTFTDKAFLSTTTDEKVAHDFAFTKTVEVPTVLHLDVPGGSKAIDVTDLSPDKMRSLIEKEVILSPDSQFVVESVEKIDGNDKDARPSLLVKARLAEGTAQHDAATTEHAATGDGPDAGAAPGGAEEAPGLDAGPGDGHTGEGAGDGPDAGVHGDTGDAGSPVGDEGLVEAAAAANGEPIDTSTWTKVSGPKGSNDGGIYKSPDGKLYYLKKSKSAEHAKNEVLADNLYKLAGIETSDLQLADVGDGKIGTVSEIMDGAKPDLQAKLHDPAYKAKLQEGFAVDAWLANWDVTGTGFDNVMTDKDGVPVRIDPGGALLYRAMGDPKGGAFGNTAGEWDTLRDGKNYYSSAAFGDITDAQLKESALKVAAISPDQIDAEIDKLDFNPNTAEKLKSTLKARRLDIMQRAGVSEADLAADAPNADPYNNVPDADTALAHFDDAWRNGELDGPATYNLADGGTVSFEEDPTNEDNAFVVHRAPDGTLVNSISLNEHEMSGDALSWPDKAPEPAVIDGFNNPPGAKFESSGSIPPANAPTATPAAPAERSIDEITADVNEQLAEQGGGFTNALDLFEMRQDQVMDDLHAGEEFVTVKNPSGSEITVSAADARVMMKAIGRKDVPDAPANAGAPEMSDPYVNVDPEIKAQWAKAASADDWLSKPDKTDHDVWVLDDGSSIEKADYVNPDGVQEWLHYDPNGGVLQVWDENGNDITHGPAPLPDVPDVPETTDGGFDVSLPGDMSDLDNAPVGSKLVTGAGHEWTKNANGKWKRDDGGDSSDLSLQMSFKWGNGEDNELYTPKKNAAPEPDAPSAPGAPDYTPLPDAPLAEGDLIDSPEQIADLPPGSKLSWNNGVSAETMLVKGDDGIWREDGNGIVVDDADMNESIFNGEVAFFEAPKSRGTSANAPSSPAPTETTNTPSGDVPVMPFKQFGTDANGNKYVSTPDGQHLMVGTVVKSKTDGIEGKIVQLENNGEYVRVENPNGGKPLGRKIKTLDVTGGEQPKGTPNAEADAPTTPDAPNAPDTTAPDVPDADVPDDDVVTSMFGYSIDDKVWDSTDLDEMPPGTIVQSGNFQYVSDGYQWVQLDKTGRPMPGAWNKVNSSDFGEGLEEAQIKKFGGYGSTSHLNENEMAAPTAVADPEPDLQHLADWEKELLGYPIHTDQLTKAKPGSTFQTTGFSGQGVTWTKSSDGDWYPDTPGGEKVGMASHLFASSISQNKIHNMKYASDAVEPSVPEVGEPDVTPDAPGGTLPDVPKETVGLDADGNKFVYAGDGKPMVVGTTVRSTKDGFEGTVVTVEKNGTHVQVKGPDGTKKGRAIGTLEVTGGATATPFNAPAASTPEPDVTPEAAPLADGTKLSGPADLDKLPVGASVHDNVSTYTKQSDGKWHYVHEDGSADDAGYGPSDFGESANEYMVGTKAKTPVAPSTPEPVAPAAPQLPAVGESLGTVENMHAMPIGTQIKAGLSSWTKTGDNEWTSDQFPENVHGAQDFSNNGTTVGESYTVTSVGGATDAPVSDTGPEINEQITTKEQLDALPAGTIIKYDTGATWHKEDDGKWRYHDGHGLTNTTVGSTVIVQSAENIPLKVASKPNAPAASAPTPTPDAPVAPTAGVHKVGDVLEGTASDWTAFPVGGTVHDVDGDTWVKNDDGSWTLTTKNGHVTPSGTAPFKGYGPFTVQKLPGEAGAVAPASANPTTVEHLKNLPDGTVLTTDANITYKKVDGKWFRHKTEDGWTGSYQVYPTSILQKGNPTVVSTETAAPSAVPTPEPVTTPAAAVPDVTIPGVQLLGANGVAFKKGDRVSHPTFGMGTVSTVENQGTHARIKFDSDPADAKPRGIVGKKLTKVNADGTTFQPPAPVAGPAGQTITPDVPTYNPSSPWFGKPAPVAPPTEQSVLGTEDWVPSGWLQKAEVHYKQFKNPNKTIQESGYWGKVDNVIKSGNKEDLDKIRSSNMISQELHAEALDAINARNQKLAGAIAAQAAAKQKYESDLAEWKSANGLTDPKFTVDSYVLKGMDGALEESASKASARWAKHQNANAPGLYAHKGKIGSYVSSSFDLNGNMRKDKNTLAPGYKPSSTHNQSLYSGMKPAMEKATTFQQDEIVMRGGGYREWMTPEGKNPEDNRASFLQTWKPGMVAVDWAFGSTSVGAPTQKYETTAAMAHKPVQIKIRVPKGYKGIYVGYGVSIGGLDHENEIILPPGTAYYIHSIEVSGSRVWVDAEIVPLGWTPEQGKVNEQALIDAAKAAVEGVAGGPAGAPAAGGPAV